MAGPLLETKIRVPWQRRTLVARPRLSERLTRGSESALTLVSAPAGFGKTTLLTEWLSATAADGRSVAWVSLDQRDNDPALFWAYVVAALRAAALGGGGGELSDLQTPVPPTEAGLAALLNDLQAFSNEVVLVLDDYHVIDSRDVHDAVAFLLAHLPRQIHLVIASRADPPLPLARLRARGDLVEIRAADLRFTPDEAAAYLNGAMGLTLTAADVTALEGRTEGWIAALQLAALSIQGREDPGDVADFIAGFAGDDRYIVDYLIEEVLQRQPENVREFLLHTSILSRLTGALCDAVTGETGSKGTLDSLDRGNLFLVSLDDRRHWYRYHHLFGDVLRARLLDEQPVRVTELHHRASEWCEQNGERSEAIRHALAAEDFDRAADLIELSITDLARNRQDATLRQYLEALPDDVIKVRPVLSVAWAGALMVRGEVVGVEAHLLDAERWLDSPLGTANAPQARSAEMVVVDEKLFHGLPTAIALYRAGQALVLGDVAGTIKHARRALDLVDDDDHVGHASPASLLGLAYWRSGDLEAAHRWYSDAMASFARAGHHTDVIGSVLTLAEIRTAQGRLGDALATYERGLQIAAAHAAPVLRGVADIHVGMSTLFRERNDLGAAQLHLQTSNDLGDHASLPQNRRAWCVAMAGVREDEGDLDAALDLLDQAQRHFVNEYSPDVRPLSALRARVWLTQGALGDALRWVRERGLSVDDNLNYLREFEHITVARVLLAEHAEEHAESSISDAATLLGRLLRAAEHGDRTGSVIEILVLQALAHQTQGDVPAALESLRRAMTLAEPEGYVRVFVAEGPPMAGLLKSAAKQGIAPALVRRLSAVSKTENNSPVQQGLIEPLSDRELDVLRLLRTDLDGPGIARELVVSLNTVRTHTKHIYAKLGVTNRRAAVLWAEELDLVSRTRDRP